MFRNRFTLFYFLIAIVLILGQAADGADSTEVTLARIQETLTVLQHYDYGQSREALMRFSGLVRAASDQDTLMPEIESAMCGFLESDAPFAAKQFICKEISLIGTRNSVPALTRLLKEDQTADIALYALQRIPDAEADKTLRDAAYRNTGRIRAGIVSTLGQRRNIESLGLLTEMTADDDPMVSAAAIAAMGKLATREAADRLMKRLNGAPVQRKNLLLDALLNIASQPAFEDRALALSLYRKLYAAEMPGNVRAAALRGLAGSAGEQTVPIIRQAVYEDDPVIRSAAIALIRDLPETTDVAELLLSLPPLAPEHEIQLLAAVRDRADKKTAGIARVCVRSENAAVRIAGFDALAVLGNAGDIRALANAAAVRTGAEKEAARMALYRLNDPQADDTILAEIQCASVPVKCELIRSAGRRPVRTAVRTLLETAKHEDIQVRIESLKSLAVISEPDVLPALLNLLVSSATGAEMKEAQKTVTLVCGKIEEDPARSDLILSTLAGVNEPDVCGALLEVLGRIGSSKAMPVLGDSIHARNTEIRLSAIRALSEWPDGTPMPDLLMTARNVENESERILALRGYIDLVKRSELEDDAKVSAYQEAFELARHIGEKRRILSALSEIETLASLEMLGTQLDNPEVRAEAEAGIMQLRQDLMKSHPEELKILLRKIAEMTKDARIRTEAEASLEKFE